MKAVSVIFFIISLVLIITGFYVMFTYGDYDSKYNMFGSTVGHIVGGDAYNFIIIGVRGVGFIIAGLTASLIACVSLLLEKLNYIANQKFQITQSNNENQNLQI